MASIDTFLQPEFGQFFVFLHITKEKDIFLYKTQTYVRYGHFLSAKGQEKKNDVRNRTPDKGSSLRRRKFVPRNLE